MRLKVLIAINLVLLASIFLSLNWENEQVSTLGVSSTLFALTDTVGIDSVKIGSNTLVKRGAFMWKINNKYDANPDRVASLLAIMQRIEVKRPVSNSIVREVSQAFERKGLVVRAYAQGVLKGELTIAEFSGETYAAQNEDAYYNIYIPGYVIDLYNFFGEETQAWRDRHILYTTWRTLKELQVTYPGDLQNSFKIYFDSAFYAVEGVQKLDSAKLYRYIQQYQEFEVVQFLPSAAGIRDSLVNRKPICQILLADLYPDRDNELKLYPGKDGFYGISSKTNEAVLLDPRMLRNFLLRREEFVRQSP